jgi:hypothetical protein
MHEHAVTVDVTSPPHFDRLQLLLRILLAAALGWIGITGGWLTCALYVSLPIIAAIAASSLGSTQYLEGFGIRVWRVLSWLLQLSAYMLLLVDRFPTGDDSNPRIEIRVSGKPSAGSALVRLITAIPSWIVLAVLWIPSSILVFVAALFILFGARMPQTILAYQRGILRWQARALAYHASLVEEYPPFAFDSDASAESEPHAASA